MTRNFLKLVFFSHECNGLTLAAIYMAQRREGSIITQISI